MSDEIKVVYILNSATKYAGANKSFLNMLEGVQAKQIVPLVILPENGEICSELDLRKVPYTILPYYQAIYPVKRYLRDIILYLPRFLRLLLVNNKAKKQIENLVLEFKPDLIHTNVGPLHIGYKVAKSCGISHVWHLREYQDLDFNMFPLFSMKSFIKKLKDKNNYPITITDGISNHFFLAGKARTISNGIFKEDSIQFIPEKEAYFLFAGRLEVNKGIQDLIVAFSEFVKSNDKLDLYIAGDTADLNFKNALISLSKNLNIYDRVKFLGMRDDIGQLMALATALVVPSLHEGFGRITVEAMFNGCLVIGNNSAGTKEILEKDNLGILYSGQEQLVSAMKNVAENTIESYYPVIKKAQKIAQKLYSQEQNANAVFNYYNEILNKRSSL